MMDKEDFEGGVSFQKLLDIHINQNDYQVDFDRLVNLQGVIFVNDVMNTEAIAGGQDTFKKTVTRVNYKEGWNDPASWDTLNGVPSNLCKAGQLCNLHLHSHTSSKNLYDHDTSLYSNPTAVGIIFGNGNIGSGSLEDGNYLKPLVSSDLFMSRDAGQNWQKVAEGPWIVAVGDQGGLMVRVRALKPTNLIL